ncbi:MAG: MmgE/PrpD family protein [Pseudomonadota bacterium]
MSAAVETLDSGRGRHPLALQFAEFAASFSLDQVPSDVVEYAKLCIADTIGIGFASHRYDFASASLRGISALASDGDYPVVGTTLRLPVRDAAMANGLLMHGLDYDDTHTGAVIHCSTSAVPLVLAEGQRRGVTGAQALAAYLLAIETDARIGMVAEGMLQKIGFHPTGLVGIFGCSVAAGLLGGLPPQQMAMAQGVALSMASGSLEFLEDGSWTKRLHPGWAAASAIQATSMAEHDFKAPLNAYEGRYGLYSLYLRADAVDTRETAATLGSEWEMNRVAIKPYPICHFNHASVDSMLALVRDHGLTPDDIESATVLLHDKQHDVVCRPEAAKRRPQNDYDAKFSVHFAVAAAAVRHRFTLEELADDALNDPAILALADRITFQHDDDSRYPEYYSGGIVVTTRDGRTLGHREPINRGADSRRLSATDVREKFMANTVGHLSAAAATRLWDAIQSLDTAANLDTVTASLCAEV